VRFNGKQRQIILRRGEAFFDVGRDPKRPFSVIAGDNIVRDIGTQFNLNLRARSLEVSVVKGEVSITPGNAAPVAVKASQRATVDLPAVRQAEGRTADHPAPATTETIAVRLAPLPTQSAIALREGRQFYDDAALGDIVEDLNRYYAPGISLASPDIAGRRLTASLAPRDIDAFLAGLPITAGVEVRRDSDGHVTILPQKEAP
jgi:transmembrane sensor